MEVIAVMNIIHIAILMLLAMESVLFSTMKKCVILMEEIAVTIQQLVMEFVMITITTDFVIMMEETVALETKILLDVHSANVLKY